MARQRYISKKVQMVESSFGDTINLSNNTGDSTDPYLASSNDMNIYVVWRDNSAGTEQIYFKRSTDGGAEF